MEPGMCNCAMHVEWQFQTHILYNLILMYLWLPLGLIALYRGFIKNVIGWLQTWQQLLLQAIWHFAYTVVDSIQWVDYGSWLSQPEGVHMYLEAYPEHWLVFSALIVFTWQIDECYVQWCGAWKLVKANFAVLPIMRKPPDPPLGPAKMTVHKPEKKHPKPKSAHKSGQGVKKPLKPVNGHKQKVKCNLCRLAAAAVLLPMLLFEQAVAQVPTFEFHSEITRSKCHSSCEHGYLSIREVSLENQDMVHLWAVMQEILQGLFGEQEAGIHFIVDSGASRTSTFDSRILCLAHLNCLQNPQY